MKFFYVYILHNSSKNFIYIGYSEDLKQRVISHNKGENKSTKPYLPLELIHYEAYKNMKDAKRRELYLKSNRGKTTLMTMLKEFFASCATCSAQIDQEARESYVIYKDQQTGTYHQMFYPDVWATLEKIRLTNTYKLGGVAVWALGYDGKSILHPLEKYKNSFE